MSVSIQSITSKNEWENFLDVFQPHTFLHSWHWGEFNKKLSHSIFRLGIFDNQKLRGVALAIKIKARRGCFLFVPHGPLIQNDCENYFKVLLRYLCELAKKEKVHFLRVNPLLENTATHKAMFKNYRFRNAPMHVHAELMWILNLASSLEELLSQMRKNTRYSIRKAEKDGVEIIKSVNPNDLILFQELYAATADRQKFTPFSSEYLEKEFEEFAKDNNVLLVFGKYNGEIIGGAFIVFSQRSAFYHHGASIPKYPSITASHLVQWEVIKEAKRRGCQFYNFWGVAREGASSHPWAGHTLFKKGFGGFSYECVHTEDLVLNWRYWFNFFVEKARKAKRGL